MVKLLQLSELREAKQRGGFTVEYRYPFLGKFRTKIMMPAYYGRTWRAWSGTPTAEQRAKRRWHDFGTICEMCKKGCGGCSWSDYLEPVDGWKATPTTTQVNTNHTQDSFEVRECPLFEPGRGRKDMDEQAIGRLLEAMMETARADYILGGLRERLEIERWLATSPFLTDPDNAIKELRDQARICDLHPEKKRKFLAGKPLDDDEDEQIPGQISIDEVMENDDTGNCGQV